MENIFGLELDKDQGLNVQSKNIFHYFIKIEIC